MIFLEKKGRFGNFLFQYFLAKVFQKKCNKKIIIFSKNENNYYFNSKNNIDNLIKHNLRLPKFSKLLMFLKKFCIEINDLNFQEMLKHQKLLDKKNIFISGFFQNINFINENKEILKELLDPKKVLGKELFSEADLTIHIRHLEDRPNLIDDHPMYQKQPNIEFYRKIINRLNPNKIKIISSNRENETFLRLKDLYKDQIFFEGINDIYDFFNIMHSKNIVLSVSTFSLWPSLLSSSSKVFVPNVGIMNKILNNKILQVNSNFEYINI